MPLCQEILVVLETWAHMRKTAVRIRTYACAFNSVLQQPGAVPELWLHQQPQSAAAVLSQCHRDLHLHADGLLHSVTDNQLTGDCHDQHARCNSNCVCHLSPLPSAGRQGCGPPTSSPHASYKPLIRLPPGEKAAQAQSRSYGTVTLALLEPTAPPPNPTPQASLERPDISWLPKESY